MRKIFSSLVVFTMILSLVGSTIPQVTRAQEINPQVVLDLCLNMDGLQNPVPAGYHRTGDNCYPNEVPDVDQCPNIDGMQAAVPAGKHKAENGDCVPNVVVNPCPEGTHLSGDNCVPDPAPDCHLHPDLAGCEPDDATVTAVKIVCPSEDLLPNWGAGDSTLQQVTSNTATRFLNTHPTCHLENWDFAWSLDGVGNPGDETTGAGGAGWNAFSDATITNIPGDARIWFREQFQTGYIPFGGESTTASNSAEFYCGSDVLNYDNWEFIDTVEGATYNCVAFNVLEEGPSCDANASAAIVSDTTNTNTTDAAPAVEVTPFHPGWTASIPGATWIWATNPVVAPTNDVNLTKTFTKTFTIIGTPTSGTLDIAADNHYTLRVNGNTVATVTDENNFEGSTQDSYNVLPYLVSGLNTIEVDVTNKEDASESADPAENPAGLLYKLSLTNDECVNPPPVDVCTNIDGNQATLPQGYHFASAGICVPDEVPLVCDAQVNLLSNPSFEAPVVTNAALWDIFPSGTPGLSWIVSWLNPTGAPAIANAELQQNTLLGVNASAGTQWTELDSDWDGPSGSLSGESGAVSLTQTIPTIPGKTYKVSFDFMPRPDVAGNESKIEALHDTTVGSTVDDTAGAGWTNHFFTFVANDASADITFRDAGIASNSVGTLLDNTSVMCQPEEEEETGHLIVKKVVVGGDTNPSAFSFSVDGGPSSPFSNDPAGIDVPLSEGTHTVVETPVPEDWDLTVSCIYEHESVGSAIQDGEEVIIDSDDDVTCTFTNTFNPDQGSPDVTVTIIKYIDADNETPLFPATSGNTNSAIFPLTSTWDATNIGAGSGDFSLGPVTYLAETADMTSGADYSVVENLGSVCTAENENEYVLEGYKLGDSEAAALLSPTVLSADFTNITSDKFVIVINKLCGEVLGDETVQVHIYKYLGDANSSSQIPDISTAPNFPMTSSWDATNIGAGSGSYDLGTNFGGAALRYAADTAAMSSGADYTTSEVTDGNPVYSQLEDVVCPAGKYRLAGYKSSTVDLATAEASAISQTAPSFTDLQADAYVIVVNTDCTPVPPTCPATYSDLPSGIRLESGEGYVLGSIDGQNGWSATGPYDQAVVSNTYGYSSFEGQSLRMSDAITSDSFGDWVFVQPLANAAGESDSTDGTFSRGTLQNHFEAQFDTASTIPCAQQLGLHISASPDRGDGSRMSYVRLEDGPTGLDVFFDDVSGTDAGSVSFDETQIGTGLERSIPHKIKFVMDFVDGTNGDGSANDVVKVYIDGVLMHTGTSWETYYRYDSEASAEQTPRIVKTLIIQARGTATPANSGNGYLFDNFNLLSSGADSGDGCPAGQHEGGDGCVTDTECSDGVDNADSEDDLADASDPGCWTDPNDSSTYDPNDTDETDQTTIQSSSNSSGSRRSSSRSPGEVLGAATDICNVVDTYMRKGYKNVTEEVLTLQNFLNGYMNSGLVVDGIFGPGTEAAVRAFQLARKTVIMDPWGLTAPTGIFYKTSLAEAKRLMCPDEFGNLPIPTDLVPWSANPAQVPPKV